MPQQSGAVAFGDGGQYPAVGRQNGEVPQPAGFQPLIRRLQRLLQFDTGEYSFSTLCRRYAPDIPPTAMFKELQRVGAIAEQSDGALSPTMRYYMPDSQDPDAVLRTGSVLEDIGSTAAYNLDRDAQAPTRFEGRASNANIRASAVREFRAWLETEAQAFLERADEWLARHEKNPANKRPERSIRLGLGVYQIQDEDKDHENSE